MLHYLQCRHKSFCKLKCTSGCEALCPPDQRELGLLIRFAWQCEDCHGETWARATEERGEVVDSSIADLQDDETIPMEIRKDWVDLKLQKQFWDDQLMERKRVEQIEKIEEAKDWATRFVRLEQEFMNTPNPDIQQQKQDLRRQLRNKPLEVVLVRDTMIDLDELILAQQRSFKLFGKRTSPCTAKDLTDH